MELSKQSRQIFDPVRKKWVESTPEEIIRQTLIEKMLGELGYPLSFLAVERELSQLPHLQLTPIQEIPKRRADIIVFAKKSHLLFPLLMIECKAVALTPKFANQVVGYNTCVQAPFLALANGERVLTGHFDTEAGHYRFEPGLPSFTALISSLEKGEKGLLSDQSLKQRDVQ